MNPAVINFAPQKHAVELRPFPIPQIGEADVLLEVAAVGVCGSDLHQWTADHSWHVNYPVVLGHEFAGTVHTLGQCVRNFAPGDRVVSETAAVINPDSPLTRQGLYNLDPDRKGFGYGVDGAMTRFVRVPARCLHRLPDSLPFEIAAMCEPCCVAYSAVVNSGNVKPGDRILVFGPGTIGLLCAAMARLQGAVVGVVGLEQDRTRLEIARKLGCTPLIGNALEWARETDSLGADGAIDAAGISATLQSALQAVRPNGWISKVGWGRQPLGFSLDPLVAKNITLKGSFSHNWPIWERIIRLLATGQLDPRPVLGGVWPLDEWQTAFEQMHSGQIAKAVLKP